MKAMILAAGLGTRMGKMTENLPKALVPFNGIPLLEIQLKRLYTAGFNDIVINLHHKSELIEEYLKNCPIPGITLTPSFEKVLLDTGGGIKNARALLGTEPVLFHNVDVLTDFDLADFYQKHVQSGALVSLAVKDRPTSRHLLLNPQGLLVGWSYPERHIRIISRETRKPPRETAFSAIYILNPEVFQYFPEEDAFSLTPWLLELSKSKDVASYDHSDGQWYDLGSESNFRKAEKNISITATGTPERISKTR